MPFGYYVWWMPFPEGMQLILVGLVLVLKFAFFFSLLLQKCDIPKIWNSFNENHKGFEHLCYICGFQEIIFFLVTAIIKLFIAFWGFDSSYIKLLHEYKDIKYCCFFVVSSRLCLWFGVFDFPWECFWGEYCNELLFLLVAFEIQMSY